MKLLDLHAQHRRHLASLRRSPATLDYYKYALEPLDKFLAERGLPVDTDSLSKPLLQDFQLWLRESRKMKPGGEHAVMRGVRAALRWAHEEELIPRDPTAKLKLITVPQSRPPAVQPEEAREALRIAATMEQPLRNRALLLTLLDTGVRAGELLQLRVEDVDLERGMLKVRAETAKRKRERLIPVGIKCGKAIAVYTRKERKPAFPHVPELFLNRSGEPMTKGVMDHLMLAIGQQAGIPRSHLAPHAWRRAFATSFLRHGGDVFALQQLMGHSTLEQTRVYCRYLPDDLQRQHLRASPADRL